MLEYLQSLIVFMTTNDLDVSHCFFLKESLVLFLLKLFGFFCLAKQIREGASVPPCLTLQASPAVMLAFRIIRLNHLHAVKGRLQTRVCGSKHSIWINILEDSVEPEPPVSKYAVFWQDAPHQTPQEEPPSWPLMGRTICKLQTWLWDQNDVGRARRDI